MVNFNALLVTYDLQTSELSYVSKPMKAETFPENTKENVELIIGTCNLMNDDPHIQYVDMCGYIHDNAQVLWEIDEDY